MIEIDSFLLGLLLGILAGACVEWLVLEPLAHRWAERRRGRRELRHGRR